MISAYFINPRALRTPPLHPFLIYALAYPFKYRGVFAYNNLARDVISRVCTSARLVPNTHINNYYELSQDPYTNLEFKNSMQLNTLPGVMYRIYAQYGIRASSSLENKVLLLNPWRMRI